MNEPALTEAVKTDLPSPKPNRRKRLALRFAVLVAAVSLLGAAYWFTRPPELVWWRSPRVGKIGFRVKTPIPSGWELSPDGGGQTVNDRDWSATYLLKPVDRRPWIIRVLSPFKPEKADMRVNIGIVISTTLRMHYYDKELKRTEDHQQSGYCDGVFDGHTYFYIGYKRAEVAAFNRTFRQICNSLKIE